MITKAQLSLHPMSTGVPKSISVLHNDVQLIISDGKSESYFDFVNDSRLWILLESGFR